MLIFKKGMTAIELLIIVALVSILSALSYQQYTQYIRMGRQLEAKSNLSVIYQKQLTYFSAELKFSESLKTIGAVPKGRIRYNIGTDWVNPPPPLPAHPEARLNQGAPATDLCPCHNDERGQNNHPTASCWADPNPEGTGACGGTEVCYGPNSSSSMATQVTATTTAHNIPTGGFKISDGIFEYYAIGCTSPQLRQELQLDVWSINHKKNLKNIKSGL